MQRITSKGGTAPLGQDQLQHALNQALRDGPAAVAQQVRYLLAYSQLLGQRPSSELYRSRPLSAAQARLAGLVEFAPSLGPGQLQKIVTEIEQIRDLVVRLPLLAQLVTYLPVKQQARITAELRRAAEEVEDPVIRARCLLRCAALPEVPQDTARVLPDIIELAVSLSNTEARVRSLMTLAQHTPVATSQRLLVRILDDLQTSNSEMLRSNAVAVLSHFIPLHLRDRLLDIATAIQGPLERTRALNAIAQVYPDNDALRSLTLAAMADIRSEEERVEALNAFKVHLESANTEHGYPEVLQQALAIAVGVSRRPMRARALVALSPYLTPDLQGEALGAVHSLGSERDRARLLAELAPHLPPEMLVASLAVAHTMREQDSRVHALTVLAHYVPTQARSQTLLDAFAAASNLSNHYERVRALLDLVDILPPQLQEQAFTMAIESTRLIENENARARALALLGHHLPAKLLERALDATYHLKEPEQRLTTLASLVPNLVATKQRDAVVHMLSCVSLMPFEYKRARALISIAPHLTADLMDDALGMAQAIVDPFDKVSALVALLQNMPPERRPALVQQCWLLIGKIDDGYDRASALAAIAPFLPAHHKQSLPKLVGMTVGAIMDEYDQASAISILAPVLAEDEDERYNPDTLPDPLSDLETAIGAVLEIPYQALRTELAREAVALWSRLDTETSFRVWQFAIQRLKTLPLADVLLFLGAAMPVIRIMAGDQGVAKVTQILGIQE